MKTSVISAKYISILTVTATILFALSLLLYGFQVSARGEEALKNSRSLEQSPQAPDVLRTIITEGFEDGTMPPTGWTHIQTNATSTWKIGSVGTYSGTYSAQINGDPNKLPQNEILLTPYFNPTQGSVSFWSYGWLTVCIKTQVICDLEVYYVKGDWDGGVEDDILLGSALDDWGSSLGWYPSSLDFSSYADGSPARIGFRAFGLAGENGAFTIKLDEIKIDADVDYDVYFPLTFANYTQKDWTFMVYMVGDNDNETTAIDEFLEISSVGSTNDVNILVQLDRIGGNDTRFDDWTDTLRYYVTNGMEPTETNALVDLDEVNMGDPQTLTDFIVWGMKNYPADHYAVVVWDHGDGWPGDGDGPFYGLAYDETSSGDTLGMPELRNVVSASTGGGINPIDLFGLNASLMAMVEVDAQLTPYVGIRVGSEDQVQPSDWPYDTILGSLVASPSMTPDDLGTEIVDDVYSSLGNDGTQSAVDVSTAYDTLISEVDDFASALVSGINSHNFDIKTARENAQEFINTDYVDLYDFAYQVNVEVDDATIDSAATAVMTAVNNVVIHESHDGTSWPGAHGISIYFPDYLTSYDPAYDGDAGWLQFTETTNWDEWLHLYLVENVCDSSVILNCNFESGQGVGWSESSTNGFDLIVDTNVLPSWVHPRSGEWLAWFGGNQDSQEEGRIWQQVTVPESKTNLTFWYQLHIAEELSCATSNGNIYVEINDTVVWSLEVCYDNHQITWEEVTIDISAYENQSVKLEFFGDFNDFSDPPHNWYVDDIDLVP